MNDLQQKANELRSALPKQGGGTAPQDTGIRLTTFQRPEGELRFTWNVYEDRPYLRFQLWTKGEDGSFWPVKGQGLTIKVKELPDLAEGVQKALDLAIAETKQAGAETKQNGGGYPSADKYRRSREGVGAEF